MATTQTSADKTGSATKHDRRSPASARRNEIIATAARLFDDVGYNHASMEDLAEAVGLAKPSLYHYFSGKEEILYCIHREFIDLLIGRQQKRLASQAPPEEQLRGIMQDILGLMSTRRGHVRVFFEHHRELPEDWKRAVTEQRSEYRHLVEDVVRRGIESGAFREVDVELSTLAIFGMCNWSYQWFRTDGRRSALEVADQFYDVLVNGL